MKKDIYVSTDIETDGPCPGLNSMLSVASVAFTEDGPISEFSANLTLLPDAAPHPATSAFWLRNTAAYEATRKGVTDPRYAFDRYKTWLAALGGRPIFVAYPAGFDFTFVYWYFQKFTGGCPFGFSALDMKTYAFALLGRRYIDAAKRNFPKEWFPKDLPHTHVALDDAREQAEICLKMLQAARQVRNDAAELDRMRLQLVDQVLNVVSSRELPPAALPPGTLVGETPQHLRGTGGTFGPLTFCEGEPGGRSI